jgi:hypothetical protein
MIRRFILLVMATSASVASITANGQVPMYDDALRLESLRSVVVQIEVEHRPERGPKKTAHGSGILLYYDDVSHELAILTARHVLIGDDEDPFDNILGYQILFYGDRSARIAIEPADLWSGSYFDRTHDLTLFKVKTRSPPNRFASLSLASSPGDRVFAVGYKPSEQAAGRRAGWMVEQGALVVNSPGDGQGRIRHTAAIEKGFSGGPLFDRRGELIAMNVKQNLEDGGGFAVPMQTVLVHLRSHLNPTLLSTADEIEEQAYASYRLGIKRASRRTKADWQAVSELMQSARARFPFEGDPITLRGMRTTSYVPSYYLGLAELHLGNCDKALEAWADPSIARALGGPRRAARLERYRARCAMALHEDGESQN